MPSCRRPGDRPGRAFVCRLYALDAPGARHRQATYDGRRRIRNTTQVGPRPSPPPPKRYSSARGFVGGSETHRSGRFFDPKGKGRLPRTVTSRGFGAMRDAPVA